MFLLFVFHHILNRRWTQQLGKGKYGAFRIVQTVLIFLILICISGSMVSGIILSRHVFAFINIRGVSTMAGTVHMVCAYWGFVLMSLHLGLHWHMVLRSAGKFFVKSGNGKIQKTGTCCIRILGAAAAAYGLYAFIRRDILSYMLLSVHFVFFDYSEPVIFYIIDYTAIMGMLVFAGHWLGKALQSINRKVHTG